MDMYPDAPLIERPGQINAWDNPNFRHAVEATGCKQIILAGIITDVCKSSQTWLQGKRPTVRRRVLILLTGIAFLALSLRAEGYSI
jgi:nicotinamidase-related amidase